LHDEFDHPGQENIIDILLMAGEKDFATLTSGEVEKEFSNLCVLIKDEWQKQEQKRLQQEIIQAEKAHDTEKINILMEEFKKLTS